MTTDSDPNSPRGGAPSPVAVNAPFEWTRVRILAVGLLCLAQLLEVIDGTVVNVALPTLQKELGFASGDLQWVVNAYGVIFGGFLLLGGRTGDLVGRRLVFMGGIALFTLASFACGLANSPEALISARGIQGLGAAFASPMTLAMIANICPEGPARERAVMVWGATTGLGASAGLIIGGFLVSGPGWSWIFFVNVPIGILLILGALRYLPAGGAVRQHRRFDFVGAVTATCGLTLLAYAIAQTSTHSWGSERTLLLLGGAVTLITYFIVHEAYIAHEPLVPLSLFRNRSVTGANITSALIAGSFFSMFYITTLYMQQIMDYSALDAGLSFLPLSITLVAVAGVGPLLIPRLGIRMVLVIGGVIGGIGLILFTFSAPDKGIADNVIVPSIVFSAGMALMYIPIAVASVAGVPSTMTGAASGVMNATRTAAGALGLAVIASLVTNRTTELLADGTATADALNQGFHLGYIVSAVLMFLSAVAALFLFGKNDGRGQKIDMAALNASAIEG